jgi:hypothetical protein
MGQEEEEEEEEEEDEFGVRRGQLPRGRTCSMSLIHWSLLSRPHDEPSMSVLSREGECLRSCMQRAPSAAKAKDVRESGFSPGRIQPLEGARESRREEREENLPECG